MLAKEMLISLYDYNIQANLRVLECAARLTPEEYATAADYGHGSLEGILYHMLRTEWVWRSMSQDHAVAFERIPRPENFTTPAQLKTGWEKEQQTMRAFLAGLNESDLAATVQIKNRDGTSTPMVVWTMLMHMLLHSMQHRSEVAQLLTHYGQPPGDLDFIYMI